jgi:hypothetical protein
VIKQRILGLALALALLGTVGFAATTRAADPNLEVYADVDSVLILSVDYDWISFGQNLTFLGTGSGITDKCSNGIGGTAFIAPQVNVTISSSHYFFINRTVSGPTALLENLHVQDAAYSTCAAHVGARSLATTDTSLVGTTNPTGSTTFANVFSFDVMALDDDATLSGAALYSASHV